VAVKYQFYRVI